MPLFYNFEIDTTSDILKILATNFKKRRLEKGLSRDIISEISGVPAITIAKFEQKYTISLSAYVSLAKALGYTKNIKELLSQPLFNTMEELDIINKNKKRKRGSRRETNR